MASAPIFRAQNITRLILPLVLAW